MRLYKKGDRRYTEVGDSEILLAASTILVRFDGGLGQQVYGMSRVLAALEEGLLIGEVEAVYTEPEEEGNGEEGA